MNKLGADDVIDAKTTADDNYRTKNSPLKSS